jgi:hypothetical protein
MLNMNHLAVPLGNPPWEEIPSRYRSSHRFVFSHASPEYILLSGVPQWQNISTHPYFQCLIEVSLMDFPFQRS